MAISLLYLRWDEGLMRKNKFTAKVPSRKGVLHGVLVQEKYTRKNGLHNMFQIIQSYELFEESCMTNGEHSLTANLSNCPCALVEKKSPTHILSRKDM